MKLPAGMDFWVGLCFLVAGLVTAAVTVNHTPGYAQVFVLCLNWVAAGACLAHCWQRVARSERERVG
jgi:hypothetical protein